MKGVAFLEQLEMNQKEIYKGGNKLERSGNINVCLKWQNRKRNDFDFTNIEMS